MRPAYRRPGRSADRPGRSSAGCRCPVGSPPMIDALNVGQVKVLAIVVLVGLVVLGVVVGLLVQKIALKLGVLVVILGLIGLVWWQRSAVVSCAKAQQCSFFGVAVNVPQVGLKVPSVG